MALPCNNLNLNLYRVFYTVAKTKSFSESSRNLHISQPAISKHIQNLEYELNTILFYRTNRGIELTPEAKTLFNYVEKAYNFLMLGERELMSGKELMKGKVSIGVPTYISVNYLNNYVKKYMMEHPNIVIKMTNKDSKSLIELFNQHTIDLLILPNYINNSKSSKDLKIVELFKEKYCFVYNKDKVKNPEVNSLDQLCNKPLLLPEKNTLERKNIEEMFSRKGLTIEPIMELESPEMMLNYVNEGMGYGYILESIAKSHPELEVINLIEELPSEIISLIYSENTLTNSSKEFVHLLTEEKNN